MPEKLISEIARPLREQFEKGRQALERDNLDYALALLSQVLIQEPGFYDCRAALRATQWKKAGAKTGFFKRVLGAASSSPQLAKAQYLLHSNPVEALAVVEQILNDDPQNTTAHKILADAASAADLPKTAVLSLETLFKHSSGDPAIGRQLAGSLARCGQVQRAEQIYAELVKADPFDQELAQEYKNVCAQRTLTEGGYQTISQGEGSYRSILKNEGEAISLERENRQQKNDNAAESLLTEYLTRVQNEPSNLKLHRSIAELYSDLGRFEEAIATFEKLISIQGSIDPSITQSITSIKVKLFDQEIGRLREIHGDASPEVKSKASDRYAFLLTDCRSRVEKFPTDLQLRYELGILYLEGGQLTLAIQEFQKSQNHPSKRIQSLNNLALCFEQRKMYDLAARTLQNALKEKPSFDEEKKELTYNLGCILEKMNKPDEAIEQFKQIYEIDIGYKEVASKVDAYYNSAS